MIVYDNWIKTSKKSLHITKGSMELFLKFESAIEFINKKYDKLNKSCISLNTEVSNSYAVQQDIDIRNFTWYVI